MKKLFFIPLIALSGLMFDIEFFPASVEEEKHSVSPCWQQKSEWETFRSEIKGTDASGSQQYLSSTFPGCEEVEYL